MGDLVTKQPFLASLTTSLKGLFNFKKNAPSLESPRETQPVPAPGPTLEDAFASAKEVATLTVRSLVEQKSLPPLSWYWDAGRGMWAIGKRYVLEPILGERPANVLEKSLGVFLNAEPGGGWSAVGDYLDSKFPGFKEFTLFDDHPWSLSGFYSAARYLGTRLYRDENSGFDTSKLRLFEGQENPLKLVDEMSGELKPEAMPVEDEAPRKISGTPERIAFYSDLYPRDTRRKAPSSSVSDSGAKKAEAQEETSALPTVAEAAPGNPRQNEVAVVPTQDEPMTDQKETKKAAPRSSVTSEGAGVQKDTMPVPKKAIVVRESLPEPKKPVAATEPEPQLPATKSLPVAPQIEWLPEFKIFPANLKTETTALDTDEPIIAYQGLPLSDSGTVYFNSSYDPEGNSADAAPIIVADPSYAAPDSPKRRIKVLIRDEEAPATLLDQKPSRIIALALRQQEAAYNPADLPQFGFVMIHSALVALLSPRSPGGVGDNVDTQLGLDGFHQELYTVSGSVHTAYNGGGHSQHHEPPVWVVNEA